MSRFVYLCTSVLAVLLTSCSQLRAVPVSPMLSPVPTSKPEGHPLLQVTGVSPVTGPSELAGADAAVRAAISDAASRLKVASDMIQVISVSATDWSDTSLGCPQPGMFYAQVIVQGYTIMLSAGQARIEYHADKRGRVVTCK
jgi:hypothetical protein